jgi:hypothetical protein
LLLARLRDFLPGLLLAHHLDLAFLLLLHSHCIMPLIFVSPPGIMHLEDIALSTELLLQLWGAQLVQVEGDREFHVLQDLRIHLKMRSYNHHGKIWQERGEST